MSRKLMLIGGGGHAKACIDVIDKCKEYAIEGIIDLSEKLGMTLLGYPVTGTDADIEKYAAQGYWFLITIGQIKNPAPREYTFKKLQTLHANIATIISPLAYVSKYATVEAGTIIMHGAKVNAAAHVGTNCIINTNANIEHDTIVGNHTHISTNAVLNGGCKVGNRVFFGSGAVAAQGIEICDDVIVGAGAIIYKNIVEQGTYTAPPFVRIN